MMLGIDHQHLLHLQTRLRSLRGIILERMAFVNDDGGIVAFA